MARPKKLNNFKEVICKTCEKIFKTKKYKNQQYCSKTCVQQNKEIRKEYLKKRTKTNLERYGVESPLQSKEILETYKNNLIKKYGEDNPFKVKEFKNKALNTIEKRYGNKVAAKNIKIAKKISKSIKGKKKNRHNFMSIKWDKIIKHCEISDLVPLFDEEYLKQDIIKGRKFKFKCNKCSRETEVILINAYLPSCSCSNYKGYSIVEEEIKEFIQTHYSGKIEIKNKTLLSSYHEIDIYLPEANIAIEVNGVYWHSEIMGKYKNYHLYKTQQCEEKNISLFHILDYEWIYKKPLIQSIILNKLGKTPNKIYARQCVIKEIDNNTSKEFLNDNHLYGNCSSKQKIGLYYKDELVSLMTFGGYRFNKHKNEAELLRFCNKLNTNVVGAASKLLKYFIKKYGNNYKKIISFADRRYSTGNMYRKIGFDFIKFTPPSYFYHKNNQIFNRMNFQKHTLSKKLEKFDSNLTETENMHNNGYKKIWDCGNYKFEINLE
jgi:hypothetical protein